jgi:hypothetical protein
VGVVLGAPEGWLSRRVHPHDLVVDEVVCAQLRQHGGEVVGGRDAGHLEGGQLAAQRGELGGDRSLAAAGVA